MRRQRVYHKDGDGKTKNDHFVKLTEIAQNRCSSNEFVLFVGLEAILENLKLLRAFGWKFLARLKAIRLVRNNGPTLAVSLQPMSIAETDVQLTG